MENSYLPPVAETEPVADWRSAWLLRTKRAIVATVAAALVVLFLLALRGTADSLQRDPTPADIAARAGLCGGGPAEVAQLAPGVVRVQCFRKVQP